MIVYGKTVDDHTRCVHYRSATDVIAIRFRCCGRYYPCHLCHEESAGHPAERWPVAEQNEPAILCGVCRHELTIADYSVTSGCPRCAALFNEGCRLHWHLYFEGSPASAARPTAG